MAFQNCIQNLHDRHAGFNQHEHFLIEGQKSLVINFFAFDTLIKQKLKLFLFYSKYKIALILQIFAQNATIRGLKIPDENFTVRCTKFAGIERHNLNLIPYTAK